MCQWHYPMTTSLRGTKSRGPKGLQLEVGARRAPKLIVAHISQLSHPRRGCTFFKPVYFFPQGTRKGLLWAKFIQTKYKCNKPVVTVQKSIQTFAPVTTGLSICDPFPNRLHKLPSHFLLSTCQTNNIGVYLIVKFYNMRGWWRHVSLWHLLFPLKMMIIMIWWSPSHLPSAFQSAAPSFASIHI